MNKYYILVEEWDYPCESGREVVTDTYDADEKEAALNRAKELCEAELDNYEANTKCDALDPEHCIGEPFEGYIITPKNGLDRFYYAVRVIEVGKLN